LLDAGYDFEIAKYPSTNIKPHLTCNYIVVFWIVALFLHQSRTRFVLAMRNNPYLTSHHYSPHLTSPGHLSNLSPPSGSQLALHMQAESTSASVCTVDFESLRIGTSTELYSHFTVRAFLLVILVCSCSFLVNLYAPSLSHSASSLFSFSPTHTASRTKQQTKTIS